MSNVFDISRAKKKKVDEKSEELLFGEIMKKNKATEEKLAKKRISNNKGVLRSYKIKAK